MERTKVITINAKQMKIFERALAHIKNGVPKVVVPAINRALASGKTVVKREIRKDYTIKAKDIPVEVHRANRATMSGALVIRDRMLDLNKFQFTPRNPYHSGGRHRVVHATVRRGGGGDIAHAFIQQMPTGYLGPFRRKKGAGRLPIKKLLAISAPIMASQPSVGPAVTKAMGDTLDKRLDHELKRILQTGEK